jgi:hypothetical protein
MSHHHAFRMQSVFLDFAGHQRRAGRGDDHIVSANGLNPGNDGMLLFQIVRAAFLNELCLTDRVGQVCRHIQARLCLVDRAGGQPQRRKVGPGRMDLRPHLSLCPGIGVLHAHRQALRSKQRRPGGADQPATNHRNALDLVGHFRAPLLPCSDSIHLAASIPGWPCICKHP